MDYKALFYERYPEAARMKGIDPNASEEAYKNALHAWDLLERAGQEWAEIKARAEATESARELEEAR